MIRCSLCGFAAQNAEFRYPWNFACDPLFGAGERVEKIHYTATILHVADFHDPVKSDSVQVIENARIFMRTVLEPTKQAMETSAERRIEGMAEGFSHLGTPRLAEEEEISELTHWNALSRLAQVGEE